MSTVPRARLVGLDPEDAHQRIARGSPAEVDPARAAELDLLEHGGQFRVGPCGRVDEGQADRFHAIVGLRQLGADRVFGGVGTLAGEHIRDDVGALRPVGNDDEVVLLGPPGPAVPGLSAVHQDDLGTRLALGDLGLGLGAAHLEHQATEGGPHVPAGRPANHNHAAGRLGIVRIAGGREQETGACDVLDHLDDLGPARLALGTTAEDPLRELRGDVLEHDAQGRLVEHLVRRRLPPGIAVGVEPGELDVDGQTVPRGVA